MVINVGYPPPRRGLRNRLRLPIERFLVDPLVDTVSSLDIDIQHVVDLESFKTFVTKYGYLVVLERPDGSLNPSIERWLHDYDFIITNAIWERIWADESERFNTARANIQAVASSMAAVDRTSTATLGDCLKVIDCHFQRVTVSSEFDSSQELVLMLNATTMEAGALMLVLLRTTGNWEYKSCKRQACGALFASRDPRKLYCSEACKIAKHKEEKSELTTEKERLRAIVYRREQELGNELVTRIKAEICEASEIDELGVVEMNYGLGRRVQGRKRR